MRDGGLGKWSRLGLACLSNLPVLEPDLDRTLRHVDFVGYPITNISGGCGVFAEFELQGSELILSRPLPLLILLLLGQGALSRWPS